uniref:Uncharacterized protein n=1 Tax=Anguilla anguilla TaxID=7936 RepID=A0A0E9RMU2_ANGAN
MFVFVHVLEALTFLGFIYLFSQYEFLFRKD